MTPPKDIMSKRPRFKRCFISAPFGTNTAVLRAELEHKGIKWSDQTRITVGTSWLDVFNQELTRSDFVCAILPAKNPGNILFELGIAWAKGKPILAFTASAMSIPGAIMSLTSVRSDVTDPEGVRLALSAFLEHARPKPLRRSLRPPKKSQGRSGQPTTISATSPLDFELQTAELLQKVGLIVSEPNENRDLGADFAIWIDELEYSLGNPLLVEVKAGVLSPEGLREAAANLRRQVLATHGRSALLIYWDRRNREFPSPPSGWPLVLQLSGSHLTTLVSEGNLIQELIRLRNNAVHGRS